MSADDEAGRKSLVNGRKRGIFIFESENHTISLRAHVGPEVLT